jgi:hypothetical protein
MGQSRTINRGLELARGELCGYLSDDDLLRPGAVRRLAEVLLERDGAVVAYPAYEIIDEAGTVMDTITPTEYSLVESVRLHDAIVGAGALFRLATARRIGGWDSELRYRADYDFWLRLAAEGELRLVAEPLAAWRYHPAASTVADAGGLQMSNESLQVLDKVYAADPLPDGLEAVQAEAYRNAFIQAAMVLTLGGNDPGERFYVYDRHMPRISEAAASSAATPEAMLSAQLANLDGELGRLRDEVAQRDATIVGLSRPWWWRLSRRLVPARLRPRAQRLGQRLGERSR